MTPSDTLLAKMPVDHRLDVIVAIIRADGFFSTVPVLAPLPGGLDATLVNQLATLGIFMRLQVESGTMRMPLRVDSLSILIEENTTINRKAGTGFKTALDCLEQLINITFNPAIRREPADDGTDGLPVVLQKWRMLAHDASKLAYELTAEVTPLIEVGTIQT